MSIALSFAFHLIVGWFLALFTIKMFSKTASKHPTDDMASLLHVNETFSGDMYSRDHFLQLTRAAHKLLTVNIQHFEAFRDRHDLHGFCQAALQTLHSMQSNTRQRRDILDHQQAKLVRQLKTASHTHAHAQQTLDQKHKDKVDQQALLDAQTNEVNDMNDSIRREQEAIARHQRRIRQEEQRRSNAVYDLIPFHGIISAIITGDGKRAIPFYSQIDGIISAVEQELEAAETRLQRAAKDVERLEEQVNTSKRTIKEIHAIVAQLEAEVQQAQARINECDREIALTGRALTRVSHVDKRLQLLETKLTHVQHDVELAQAIEEMSHMNQFLCDFVEVCDALALKD